MHAYRYEGRGGRGLVQRADERSGLGLSVLSNPPVLLPCRVSVSVSEVCTEVSPKNLHDGDEVM